MEYVTFPYVASYVRDCYVVPDRFFMIPNVPFLNKRRRLESIFTLVVFFYSLANMKQSSVDDLNQNIQIIMRKMICN